MPPLTRVKAMLELPVADVPLVPDTLAPKKIEPTVPEKLVLVSILPSDNTKPELAPPDTKILLAG